MSNPKSKKKLSPKHKQFVKEYLIDFNASQAYIRAGYKAKTADSNANRLMGNDSIQEEIRKQQAELAKRSEITADMVIKEFAKIAFIQESDFYHEDGSAKYPYELTDDQRSALQSYWIKTVKVGDEYIDIPQFKVHDKTKSLENLGKHLGIYEADNHQQKVEPVTHITKVYI